MFFRLIPKNREIPHHQIRGAQQHKRRNDHRQAHQKLKQPEFLVAQACRINKQSIHRAQRYAEVRDDTILNALSLNNPHNQFCAAKLVDKFELFQTFLLLGHVAKFIFVLLFS